MKEWLLTISCYTHRSVIIIDTSFCVRWEEIERPTARWYVENKRLWSALLYVGCLHLTPPLRFQETMQKRRQKVCKGQKGQTTPRKWEPPNQQIHMNSYELPRTGPAWLSPGPLCVCYGIQFSGVYRITECLNGWVSDFCAFSWASKKGNSHWFVLSKFRMTVFFNLITFYFAIFKNK